MVSDKKIHSLGKETAENSLKTFSGRPLIIDWGHVAMFTRLCLLYVSVLQELPGGTQVRNQSLRSGLVSADLQFGLLPNSGVETFAP